MPDARGRRPTGWGDPPVAAPSIHAIREAEERIRPVARRTPLLRFGPARDGILLKPEVGQPTGSFKIRGVYNWAAGLAPDVIRRGFSTFSAGNTALALAHCAKALHATCRSLLPDYAPETKVQALRAQGVEPILVPFAEMADYIFRAGWRQEPYAFLNPWAEPAMLAGHATIALELLDDLPDVETVYVPVGGGALAAGVGSAVGRLSPAVRVVGVQTESYPSLAQSFRAGRPVWIEPRPTICDGVAVPFSTDQLFPLLHETLDRIAVVSEDQVRTAIRVLARSVGLTAEGAGALALAAAIATPPAERGLSVCLITGGNIPKPLLAAILAGAS